MYGRNLEHTFSNRESGITPANVAKLTQAWSFPTVDAVSASPTVWHGRVYVGAWDGIFYALDARSGKVAWRFAVDCDNAIVPIPPRCLRRGRCSRLASSRKAA